jgi:hypothetical protein
LILLIEPIQLRAIDIDDRNRSSILDNWDDDFALTGAVAGDMAWESVDVGNELGRLGGGGGAADSAGEEDGLAGDLGGSVDRR